jgi:hypothetical protein
MKTTINTQAYIRSHGKAPKGKGLWLFLDQSGNVAVEYFGLYAEAQKAAQASQQTTLILGS